MTLEQKPVTGKNAFVIGLFQVIAMIPGVSRSAATIIGGLTQGLDKECCRIFILPGCPNYVCCYCKKTL